jgi:hypothetical protein
MLLFPENSFEEELMKKIIMTLSLILCVAAFAFAAPLSITKKTGNYTVVSVFDKNPATMGKNKVTINIKDGAKAVDGAKVAVYYSMPAMPGMPAMDYKVIADGKGGVYTAVLDLSMSGPWNVEVRFILPGSKEVQKAAYSIDAR